MQTGQNVEPSGAATAAAAAAARCTGIAGTTGTAGAGANIAGTGGSPLANRSRSSIVATSSNSRDDAIRRRYHGHVTSSCMLRLRQLQSSILSLSLYYPPPPSNRHHRSNGDCLEGKRENYQVCSVQYCAQQLCTVQCTHI